MADFSSTLSAIGVKSSAASDAAEASTQNKTGNSTGTLGQADFLKLMTAQMKNQDPFNPTDNTQMIAQMAQFSSVAGIAEMNSTMKAISARLGSTSVADAATFVGKTVLTPGTVAYPRTSGGIAGAVELDGDTSDTVVTIADKSGNVVRTIDLGAQKAGTAQFDWDGSDGAGGTVEGGPFTVTVQASKGGTTVASQPLVWAPVEGVALTGAEPMLSVTGLGQVKLSAVRSVG